MPAVLHGIVISEAEIKPIGVIGGNGIEIHDPKSVMSASRIPCYGISQIL